MNIVIEGVDCSGKSTVTESLSKKLGFKVKKGSSFEITAQGNEAMYSHFKHLAPLDNVVIDRFIYSNLVYATLFPEYPILSYSQRGYIERLIKENTIVLYLTADSNTIVNRIEKRGDEYIDTSHIKDILGTYETVMEDAASNGVTVIKYDTSVRSSNEIVDNVVRMIENSQEY